MPMVDDSGPFQAVRLRTPPAPILCGARPSGASHARGKPAGSFSQCKRWPALSDACCRSKTVRRRGDGRSADA